jgi:hypothetical protein
MEVDGESAMAADALNLRMMDTSPITNPKFEISTVPS